MLGTFFLETYDDTVESELVHVLFPCSHTIVSSPQIYDKSAFNSLCLHFHVGCDDWCI